jgi:hypothetical protein
LEFDIVSAQNVPEEIHLDNNRVITNMPDKQVFTDTTALNNITFSSNISYGKNLPIHPFVGFLEYPYQTHVDVSTDEEKENFGIDNDRYKDNWFLGLDHNPLEITHEEYYNKLKSHIQNCIQ